MTEHKEILKQLRDKTIKFYTEDEVDKLIEAFRTKYEISICDGLPYHPKPIKAFIGLQIIDTEKLKV